MKWLPVHQCAQFSACESALLALRWLLGWYSSDDSCGGRTLLVQDAVVVVSIIFREAKG